MSNSNINNGKGEIVDKSRKFSETARDYLLAKSVQFKIASRQRINTLIYDERGDVPGWVLVVLMTTGLVTAIWAIANPKLTSILKNSLDSMNSVR